MVATNGRVGTRRTRKRTAAPWDDFVHAGPGTLAGRYLRRFWQPIYLARDLKPGRAVPVNVLGEQFTLYRGESLDAPVSTRPEVHAVAFRCPHRGTQLSAGWVEGEDIRCFYHGWKFDAAGQCNEQPAEPKPFCERIRIRSYPVEEYLGLVFAYLGEDERPPLPRYPEFEGEGVIQNQQYLRPCNYFNNLDNDSAHVYFVHRRPGVDWREWNGATPILHAEETEFGVTTTTTLPNGRRTATHRGMPNLLIRRASEGAGPRVGAIEWRVPVDDEHHYSFHIGHIPVTGEEAQRHLERAAAKEARTDQDAQELAELILAGALHLDDVDPARTNLVHLEDAISQVGQGRIADREQEELGHTDTGVIVWRNVWRRELRALAEGRPLKQWRVPDEW